MSSIETWPVDETGKDLAGWKLPAVAKELGYGLRLPKVHSDVTSHGKCILKSVSTNQRFPIAVSLFDFLVNNDLFDNASVVLFFKAQEGLLSDCLAYMIEEDEDEEDEQSDSG